MKLCKHVWVVSHFVASLFQQEESLFDVSSVDESFSLRRVLGSDEGEDRAFGVGEDEELVESDERGVARYERLQC